MPGVAVGDIGAKMGRDGTDNGWIQFSSVRIPRFFMLQKFCKSHQAEGDVTLPSARTVVTPALLGGRVLMVMDPYRWSAKAVIVALRYAVCRRQFKSKSQADGSETQLINYPLHQRRLFPFLAQAIVFSAGSWKLEHTFNEVLDTLDKAVETNDMKRIFASIDAMKSLFLDSAALKSTGPGLTAECIDQCRQSCGGHGYSSYSGFASLTTTGGAMYMEGDNSVLAMSVVSPVIKAVVAPLEKGQGKGLCSPSWNNAAAMTTMKLSFQHFRLALISNVLVCYRSVGSHVLVFREPVVGRQWRQLWFCWCLSLPLVKLKAHHYFLWGVPQKTSEQRVQGIEPLTPSYCQVPPVPWSDWEVCRWLLMIQCDSGPGCSRNHKRYSSSLVCGGKKRMLLLHWMLSQFSWPDAQPRLLESTMVMLLRKTTITQSRPGTSRNPTRPHTVLNLRLRWTGVPLMLVRGMKRVPKRRRSCLKWYENKKWFSQCTWCKWKLLVVDVFLPEE